MSPLSASAIAAERVDHLDQAFEQLPAVAPAPVRLLLVTDTSIAFSGGSERFLRNLAALLPRERYLITVVQLDPGLHPDMKTHPLSGLQHINQVKLPVKAIYGHGGRQAWRQLKAFLRQGQFDIVQSHHEKSDLLNAMLPLPSGCVRISNRRDMGHNKSRKMRWLSRLLNHRYDCVIAPSQPILSTLSRTEALDASRMLWIPNGVDTQRFKPWQESGRSAVRHSLDLDEAAIAFGCIARMTPEKRHVDLVSAFASVHAQVPQTRLLLIGDGPLQGQVQDQITSLGLAGAVKLMGMRPDIESLLPALDIGLLVSSTEGMSNAILEMMSCGLPVIASEVGGNPSLVQHEMTGLLVPPCRPDLLAQAMTSLATRPGLRRSLGQAARSRITRDFSLDAMVHAFDQAYQQLLAMKRMKSSTSTT